MTLAMAMTGCAPSASTPVDGTSALEDGAHIYLTDTEVGSADAWVNLIIVADDAAMFVRTDTVSHCVALEALGEDPSIVDATQPSDGREDELGYRIWLTGTITAADEGLVISWLGSDGESYEGRSGQSLVTIADDASIDIDISADLSEGTPFEDGVLLPFDSEQAQAGLASQCA